MLASQRRASILTWLFVCSGAAYSVSAQAPKEPTPPPAPTDSGSMRDYMLIALEALPPLSKPIFSKIFTIKDAVELLSGLGPAFNDLAVKSRYEKAYRDALVIGLKDAKRLGQKGVLIRSTLVKEPTPASGVDYYSLEGSGVEVIGIGPSANEVCVAQKCHISLAPPLPPNKEYVAGYAFAEPMPRGKIKVEQYRKADLETRTRLVFDTPAVAAASLAATKSAAFAGYAQALRAQLKTREDRIDLDNLIKARLDAQAALKAIEDELAAEMARVARMARTSANLEMIVGVFSLASAINIASSSVGDGPGVAKLKGATSIDDVKSIMKEIEVQTGKTVNRLIIRQRTATNVINGVETRTLTIGAELGLPGPSLLLR